MIKYIIIVSLLISTILANQILNQKIYDDDNKIDILISFKEPYNEKISKVDDKDGEIILLKNATINSRVEKNIVSPLAQKLIISPYANGSIIKIESDEKFLLSASKTHDNRGLRLRVTPKEDISLDDSLVVDEQDKIVTKKESDISSAYLKMLLILALLLLFLYLLKRWVVAKRGSINGSWLFNEKNNKQNSKSVNRSSIKIVTQRAIDHKNRVALISFEDRKYLLLIGENNLLLDRFDSDLNSLENSFESELKDKQTALDEFIQKDNYKLKSYKDKASIMDIDDEAISQNIKPLYDEE